MQVDIKLFDKQFTALEHLLDDKTNEVMYGGGARGGKSYLGCLWVNYCCTIMPESSFVIARRRFSDLRDTTLITWHKILKEMQISGEVKYNAQSHVAEFRNGSKIFFKELNHIPSDPEYDRIGSLDLTGVFLDECQQIDYKAVSVLRGRLSKLSGQNWKTIPKMLFTCNPAKNWIYSKFYKPDKEGSIEDWRVFIRSLVTDNPHVPESYIENLRRSDEITKQRLLYGNFEYDDDPSALCDYDEISAIFSNVHVNSGDIYMTADIARLGPDSSVIGVWDGWRLINVIRVEKSDLRDLRILMETVKDRYKIPTANCIADVVGLGSGIVDEMGINGFNGGSKPFNSSVAYRKLNDQCLFYLAQKIRDRDIYIGIDKYKKEIIEELGFLKRNEKDLDKVSAIPKKDVNRDLGRSPDFRDMLMMRAWFDLKPSSKNIRISLGGKKLNI